MYAYANPTVYVDPTGEEAFTPDDVVQIIEEYEGARLDLKQLQGQKDRLLERVRTDEASASEGYYLGQLAMALANAEEEVARLGNRLEEGLNFLEQAFLVIEGQSTPEGEMAALVDFLHEEVQNHTRAVNLSKKFLNPLPCQGYTCEIFARVGENGPAVRVMEKVLIESILLFGGALVVAELQVVRPFIALEVPQGLEKSQFIVISRRIREVATEMGLGDDIAIQGSRAGGTARSSSDTDIAIRVDKNLFDHTIQDRFGRPNPGSAKERTMLHAEQTGKIQSGEAGLRSLRRELEKELGMDVDISAILKEGAFDNAPMIPISKE